MRAKRLVTAVMAALSLSVSYTVVFGATASADLPYCMGTYHIQANNGLYVANMENNNSYLQARTPGYALGTWERFRLFRHSLSSNGPRAYAIRASDDKWVAPHGAYLRAIGTWTPSGVPHNETYTWNGSDPPNGTFQPFKSQYTGLWVANEENNFGYLVANRSSVGAWELFRWTKLNSNCQRGS